MARLPSRVHAFLPNHPRLACGLLAAALLAAGCSGPLAGESTEFAADREPTNVAMIPFDGKRAMGYLEAVCKIGPRMSGTDNMKRQQELMKEHFEKLGGKVELQKFSGKQYSQKQAVEMANLVVSWFPDRQRRVILCSHYDTRPLADQEEDPRDWRMPFLSANDGGSGVAFLMELAHHMKDLKSNVGVDFVFFDGEEYIFDPRPNGDKYFFGSEHFAKTYRQEKPKFTYVGAVLLDMIAGKGAKFPREPNSDLWAGKLMDELWKIAAEQKCTAFQNRRGQEVNDDHIALNRIGRIPAVDIIDFDYPHWHKLTDQPSKCAPEPMEQVARVLTVWLQRVK
jgi:hypothetical protein